MPPRAYVFLAAQTQVNMGSRQNRVQSNKVLPYFSIYQRTSIPKTEARSKYLENLLACPRPKCSSG